MDEAFVLLVSLSGEGRGGKIDDSVSASLALGGLSYIPSWLILAFLALVLALIKPITPPFSALNFAACKPRGPFFVGKGIAGNKRNGSFFFVIGEREVLFFWTPWWSIHCMLVSCGRLFSSLFLMYKGSTNTI
jgi:hypothetical protein